MTYSDEKNPYEECNTCVGLSDCENRCLIEGDCFQFAWKDGYQKGYQQAEKERELTEEERLVFEWLLEDICPDELLDETVATIESIKKKVLGE